MTIEDDEMPDWFADEEFWEANYPFMFRDASFEAAPAEVESLQTLSGCESGRLLDLCCGPGRHSVPFAEAGFEVTGVDRSAFLLGKAKARGQQSGLSIEWVERDMRDFVRDAAFDLAICMCTSFGFFDAAAENLRVLENVVVSLRDGGCFVLDVMGKERLARVYEPAGASEHAEAGVQYQRRTVIDDWSRLQNVWTVVKDGVAKEFEIRHWMYSGQELKAMLEQAGFAQVQLFGDLEARPYGPQASRLVAVARKG